MLYIAKPEIITFSKRTSAGRVGAAPVAAGSGRDFFGLTCGRTDIVSNGLAISKARYGRRIKNSSLLNFTVIRMDHLPFLISWFRIVLTPDGATRITCDLIDMVKRKSKRLVFIGLNLCAEMLPKYATWWLSGASHFHGNAKRRWKYLILISDRNPYFRTQDVRYRMRFIITNFWFRNVAMKTQTSIVLRM